MSLIVSLIFTAICGGMLNYVLLPAWNVHSPGLWCFFIVLFVIFGLTYSVVSSIFENGEKGIFLAWIPFVLGLIVFIICGISGCKMFNSSKYASMVEKTIGDWDKDMKPVDSIKNIALMDTETAKVFGERKLGSLSDLVSQYDLSKEYTQINYKGNPMKISPLEYESFWKWNSNKENGIPGYVLVDPVNNDAQFVRLEKGIKYSPSERFRRDLTRTLRRQYHSFIFGDTYFEIDENGNPYWVAAVEEPTIGVFGGYEIKGAVILDACTGKSQYYAAKDIPEWVDVVFDGDYISERVDWNGMLKNGFWNSLFSAKGCTKCTDDFGYVTIGNDIWVYTGITSATSDSSNIGVILGNERTCEIKYYEIAGADEKSAMEAAEGEVANYGYVASFPSIINVNGEATYIMVLKDANNIVKEYAMVNVENYSKVVIAETQKEVFSKYAAKMGFDNLVDDSNSENSDETKSDENVNLIDVEFTIDNIQFIVNNGDTTVYISSSDGKTYKSDFDEFWILAKSGDTVKAQYADADAEKTIIKIVNFSK